MTPQERQRTEEEIRILSERLQRLESREDTFAAIGREEIQRQLAEQSARLRTATIGTLKE